MNLVLAFHNHQPVGQLPWLIEEACDSAYAPFLDALEKHPQVRVALHFTGPLLDWLETHRPQLLQQLRVLANRNQIEILGGAFYEPILALWPLHDQLAQLEKMSARLEELFGKTPRGAWLAERVWEPQLTQILPRGGARFTFIDDNAFRAAGVFGAIETLYRAEDARDLNGENALRFFPIHSELRELLPWKEPARAIDLLRAHHAKNPNAMLCFADDGEKFGAWPGTHDWGFHARLARPFFRGAATKTPTGSIPFYRVTTKVVTRRRRLLCRLRRIPKCRNGRAAIFVIFCNATRKAAIFSR